MSASRRNAVALIAGAALLIIASSTTSAVATKLITGAQIADRSITGADIKPGSVPGNRIESGSVKLEHLHESAVRAGHVYTSRGVGAKPRSRSPRGVVTQLSNSGLRSLTSLINIPPGTYLAVITGRYGVYPSTASQKLINCALEYPSSQYDYLPFYQSGLGYSEDWEGTIADSLVFKSSAPGTVSFACMTGGDYTAWADAEIVLIPVSSYAQS